MAKNKINQNLEKTFLNTEETTPEETTPEEVQNNGNETILINGIKTVVPEFIAIGWKIHNNNNK
jgi:hypothetical protein